MGKKRKTLKKVTRKDFGLSKHQEFVLSLTPRQQSKLAKLLAKVVTKVEKTKPTGNRFPTTITEQTVTDCSCVARDTVNEYLAGTGWQVTPD